MVPVSLLYSPVRYRDSWETTEHSISHTRELYARPPVIVSYVLCVLCLSTRCSCRRLLFPRLFSSFFFYFCILFLHIELSIEFFFCMLYTNMHIHPSRARIIFFPSFPYPLALPYFIFFCQ